MYIAVALIWLRVVDGVALTRWDVTGALIALVGMGGDCVAADGGEGSFWDLRWLLRQAEAGQKRASSIFPLADIHGRIGVVVRPLRE